jgi:geranylgeranyl diphosphate synthase, type II
VGKQASRIRFSVPSLRPFCGIEIYSKTIVQTSNNPTTVLTDLLDRWKDLAVEVDAKLESCLFSLSEDCPDSLLEAMRYSLLAPGKRLRPVLCMLSAESLGKPTQVALANAAALEMIHCYSLIHDDLPAMDDDDLRRGRPTCHKRFDEATAILAGDALQALAFQTILADNLEGPIARDSCLALAQAAGPEGMVGGQVDDLRAQTMVGDEALLHAIHRRKTGAMIRASVLLGGIAAGATTCALEKLTHYGECVGIAFQIVDDLLDVQGSAENTGKRTGKDKERGKLTFPGIYGVEASRERAEQFVEQAIAAIDFLGPPARPLKQLARYIMERSR